MRVFCHNCGHQNLQEANFCSSCGAPLVPLSEDTTVTFQALEGSVEGEEELTVTIPAIERGDGVLVVKRGPAAGTRYRLDAPVTRVGRHPESDIFLDDITVSRRHAEFHHDGHRFVVRDVGSLNGTYLNRVRIEEADLASGDEVQIGKFKLIFLLAEEG